MTDKDSYHTLRVRINNNYLAITVPTMTKFEGVLSRLSLAGLAMLGVNVFRCPIFDNWISLNKSKGNKSLRFQYYYESVNTARFVGKYFKSSSEKVFSTITSFHNLVSESRLLSSSACLFC